MKNKSKLPRFNDMVVIDLAPISIRSVIKDPVAFLGLYLNIPPCKLPKSLINDSSKF